MRERSDQQQRQAQADAAAAAAAGLSTGKDADEATSDFFEIDSNQWLTDAEREELRSRRRVDEEAEEARRKRFTVSIDLLGRKVLVHNEGGPAQTAGASFSTASDPVPAAADVGASSQGSGVQWDTPSGSTANELAVSAKSGPEAVKAAAEALRCMRMMSNPNISTAAPVFVSSSHPAASASGKAPPGQGQGRDSAMGKGMVVLKSDVHGKGEAGGKKAVGLDQNLKGAAPSDKRASRTGPAPFGRLQHNMFSEFDEFGADVMYGDAMAAVQAMDQGLYDLCPPEYAFVGKGAAPKSKRQGGCAQVQEVGGGSTSYGSKGRMTCAPLSMRS
eukprot:gene31287-6435_t